MQMDKVRCEERVLNTKINQFGFIGDFATTNVHIDLITICAVAEKKICH